MEVEECNWPTVSICRSYSFFPDHANGRGSKGESLLLPGTRPDLCWQKAAATVAWRPEQQPAAKDDHFESSSESLAALA